MQIQNYKKENWASNPVQNFPFCSNCQQIKLIKNERCREPGINFVRFLPAYFSLGVSPGASHCRNRAPEPKGTTARRERQYIVSSFLCSSQENLFSQRCRFSLESQQGAPATWFGISRQSRPTHRPTDRPQQAGRLLMYLLKLTGLPVPTK